MCVLISPWGDTIVSKIDKLLKRAVCITCSLERTHTPGSHLEGWLQCCRIEKIKNFFYEARILRQLPKRKKGGLGGSHVPELWTKRSIVFRPRGALVCNL